MNNASPDIADVFRAFWPAYCVARGRAILPSHQKAAADIMACMTEEMGGQRHRCKGCHHDFWTYHGCRNRSCPKCHGRQTAEWLKNRCVELLPADYFHTVVTVPAELRPLFLRYQKHLYGVLMQVAAKTLIELAKSKRYLGAEPAIMAILHTWTSTLHFHPHVHLLVTGGGLHEDGKTWCEAGSFLVPVKKLSRLIRRRFREALEKKHPDLFLQIPPSVWRKDWCVFIDRKDGCQDAVLNYLARYVFRMAITSRRIERIDGDTVTFRYKENRSGQWKRETLPGVEFIRRFLLHVLPKGFHKVRYFGLWSPAKRGRLRALAIALALLTRRTVQPMGALVEEALQASELEAHAYTPTCPRCGCQQTISIERRRRRWRQYVT